LQDCASDTPDIPAEYELTNYVSIPHTHDDQYYAHANWMAPIDDLTDINSNAPPSPDSSSQSPDASQDTASPAVETGVGEQAPASASDTTPETPFTISDRIPLPTDLSSAITDKFDAFSDAATLHGNLPLRETELVVTHDGVHATATLSVTKQTTALTPVLARVITGVAGPIDTPDPVTAITFQGAVPLIPDPTPDDHASDSPLRHDYTVTFETDTPHEYWANCESLSEYAALIAQDTDDTSVTVDSVISRDTYHSHFHVWDVDAKAQIGRVIEEAARHRLCSLVTVSGGTELTMTRVECDGDAETITGQLTHSF